MTPPQLHMHLQPSCKAGLFATKVVIAPGTHGADVTGMQGIGVKTPIAAAVAEATVGLARLEHMPNGGMFFIGMLSMMVAAGAPASNWFSGVTIKALGATPKLQVIMAPAVTSLGIGKRG